MSRTLSGLIAGDTDLTVNVNLENISASNVASGIFAVERIPDLSATKITSGTLTTARIPTLPVSKVSFLNSDVNLGSGGLVVDDVNAVDIVCSNDILTEDLNVSGVFKTDHIQTSSAVTFVDFDNTDVELGTGDLYCQNITATNAIQATGAVSGAQVNAGTIYATGNTTLQGTLSSQSITTNNGNIAMGTGELTCDVISCGDIGSTGTIICNGLTTTDDDVSLGTGNLSCQDITTTGSIIRGPSGLAGVSSPGPLATVIYFKVGEAITQGYAVKITSDMEVRHYTSSTSDNCVGIALETKDPLTAGVQNVVGVQVNGLMKATISATPLTGTLANAQVCGVSSGLITSTGGTEASSDDEFIICHLGTAGTYDSLVMWVRGSVY